MTQVETFETTEVTADGVCEVDAESVALIKKLGLEGQEALIGGEVAAPQVSPFRRITVAEAFVYGVICPTKSKAENFRAEAIPLRVLQVLDRAQELGLFKRFEIWSADLDKDPVLVAYEPYSNPKHPSLDGDCFILARWGAELEDFAVLADRALVRWKAACKSTLVDLISRAKARLEANDAFDIETAARKQQPYFGGL
jgi:hypothetical protein